MKVRILVSLIILTLLASCSEPVRKDGEKLKIKGTLLGFDGKAMNSADVFIKQINGVETDTHIKVDKNGSFNFELESDGEISFLFSGENHSHNNISFYTDSKTNHLTLDIKLKALQLNDDFSDLKIIGSFNNFDWVSAVPLNDDGNGKYSATVKNEADTVIYQVLGHLADNEGRSTNGTMQDFSYADKGGDYLSAILTSEKDVKIEFDPEKMKFEADDFAFSCNDLGINEYVLGLISQEEIVNTLMTAVRRHLPAKSNAKKKMVKKAFTRNIQPLIDLINNSKNTELVNSSILKYINITYRSQEFLSIDNYDKTIAQKFLDIYASDMMLHDKYFMQLLFCSSVQGEDPYDNKFTRSYSTNDENRQSRLNAKFMEYAKLSGDTENQKKYFDIVIANLTDEKEKSKYLRQFNPDRALEVGKQIPDFSIMTLADAKKMISHKSLKGYTLVDVWATWCGPCVGEMPYLHSAYERFKDKNFDILSISIDAKAETVDKFRQGEWKMPWTNGITENEWNSKIMDAFQVTGVPTSFLVDASGKIIATEGLRGDALLETLEEFIN